MHPTEHAVAFGAHTRLQSGVRQHSALISIDFSLPLSSDPVSQHASLAARLRANSCNLAPAASVTTGSAPPPQ